MTEKSRNVAFVGQSGAGKTSLAEAMLFNAGVTTRLGSVAVAYSGGTDSSYLLAVCLDVLGPEGVLALTADSPLTPRRELEEARALARQLGVRHIVLPGDDLGNPDVAANQNYSAPIPDTLSVRSISFK